METESSKVLTDAGTVAGRAAIELLINPGSLEVKSSFDSSGSSIVNLLKKK